MGDMYIQRVRPVGLTIHCRSRPGWTFGCKRDSSRPDKFVNIPSRLQIEIPSIADTIVSAPNFLARQVRPCREQPATRIKWYICSSLVKAYLGAVAQLTGNEGGGVPAALRFLE